MRGMVTLTLLAVILAGMLDAPPARAQATVTVDCASGDLVADALTSTAPELTVRIIGICAEDFEVTRDDVLFRGANPANDGFSWGGGDGSEVAFATVLVREARNIRFERLGFFDGSRNGLGVENTNSVEVDRCRFQNNERGIGASDSIVLVTDTVFVGNNLWDFGAFQGSFIDCTGCTTSGSQFSVLASSGGSVNVGGGTIEGNWGAVATGNGSSMFLDGTDITAASMGLSVERNAQ